MKKISATIIAALLFVLTATYSYGGTCHNITGFVSSVPDPTCQIEQEFPEDRADVFLPTPNEERCFSIIGLGKATFEGFAGLTMVPVVGVDEILTYTPLGFPQLPPPFPFPYSNREYLQGFTAQAALTGRVKIRGKDLVGTIYTKDTGYIIPESDPANGAWVSQTLLIVGGEEDFEDATGIITVAGKEVGGWANYSGFICEADM